MYFAIPEEVRRSACSTHYNGTFAADVNHYIYLPPLKALPHGMYVNDPTTAVKKHKQHG